jgi:carbon-monoxide dehydrogenase medium subunit
MKPPPFEYADPRTLAEAVALLQQHGDDAKVLAGGQSLVPLLNLRLVRPAVVVDINRIPALEYVRHDNGLLAFGALTRIRVVERSEIVRARVPLLAAAAAKVGHLAIRNRGTIGGNLAHADPASEVPAVLLALEGEVAAIGPRGERTIAARDLFRGPLSTAIESTEILTEVRVPVAATRAGSAFIEVSRREGDFALAGVAALVERGEDGRCVRARIGLCGVGPTALRVPEAERVLEQHGITDEALAEVTRQVQRAVSPPDDVQASAEYRRHVAGVLAARAVRQAWDRTTSAGPTRERTSGGGG